MAKKMTIRQVSPKSNRILINKNAKKISKNSNTLENMLKKASDKVKQIKIKLKKTKITLPKKTKIKTQKPLRIYHRKKSPNNKLV